MQFLMKYWENFNASEQKGIMAGAGFILVTVTVLSYFVFSTHYAVLFSNLNDEDAARITEQLKVMKINYQLDNAGSTILVEKDKVPSTRLELTAKGALIKGGVGFELFDKTEYGMTDFTQKINFQRALQGELTRTIMSLEAIDTARVHLSLPESTLFEQETSHPKASITLKLKPGESLSAKTIEGIQRLVSASVNGLEIDNVAILDDHGDLLSKSSHKDEVDQLGKMQSKKEIELYLTKKALTVLEGVFGVGKGIVNVDVTLNYDQIQSQKEHIIPGREGNTGVLIEKKITSSKRSEPLDKKSDSKDEAVNESQELKYVVGKEIENRVSDKGNISRITASVVVPSNTTNQQVISLQAIIGNTIGIDESRGDKIEVASLPALLLLDKHSSLDIKKSELTPVETQDVGIIARLKTWFSVWTWKHWTLLATAILVVAFINAALVALLMRKGRLSSHERDALLSEIQKSFSSDATFEKRV